MKVNAILFGLFVAANVVSGAPVSKMRSVLADCADPIVAQQLSACENAATAILQGLDDPPCEVVLATQLALATCNVICDDVSCEDVAEDAISALTEAQCEAPSAEEFCAQVNDSGGMNANNRFSRFSQSFLYFH